MANNLLCTEPLISLTALNRGCFVTGVSHKVLQLGMDPDAEPEPPAAAPGHPNKPVRDVVVIFTYERNTPLATQMTQGKKGRGVSLQDLITVGMLYPGRNKLTVTYKGVTYQASLLRTGGISFQGQTFQSATAFSIYCKRLQTPGKQGDDGWKSVHYEGVPLGDIRSRFMERFPDGTIPAHAIPSAAPTAASSRVVADTDTSRDSVEAAEEDDEDDVMAEAPAPANEPAGNDQWVQCDRCEAWRIVPATHWPSVENDPRSSWFCEYATWDVTQYEPRTKACTA